MYIYLYKEKTIRKSNKPSPGHSSRKLKSDSCEEWETNEN